MSSRMALEDVHHLTAAIAADYPGITLEVAASDGEAESIELLLRVPNGDNTDSHVMRVQRLDPMLFERDLREQLQAELGSR